MTRVIYTHDRVRSNRAYRKPLKQKIEEAIKKEVATTKPVGKDYVKERLKLIKARRKAGMR
jgi:hypothetical protein